MSEGSIVSLVALVGWLILCGSSLVSFKLGWNKLLQLALIWAAIFGGLFVIADLLDLRLPN